MLAEPSIRSPVGQDHERLTDRAWEAMLHYYGHNQGIALVLERLHDLHPADGILRYAATNRPRSLVEIKSRRDFNEKKFRTKHRSKWLISNHKIINNIPIARSLGVPFVGAMHIVRDRVVLVKTIWEDEVLIPGIETKLMETQAHINNETMTKIVRCAFIPMHDALCIRY